MQRIGRSVAGTAVIAVAALSVLVLLWNVSTSRPTQTGAPATPVPITATAIPATATPVSPLPTPTPPFEISIDDYQFGEPRPILQHNAAILVGDWLPDNSRILLVTHVNLSSTGFEEITILAPATGQVEIYGRRAFMFFARKPLWLTDVEKVAFIGSNPDLLPPESGPRPQHLWVTSSGTMSLTNPLVENVSAAVGHGHTIFAIQCDTNAVLSVDAVTGSQTTLPVNLTDYGLDTCGSYLQMAQHPSLPLAAIFDPNHFIVLNLLTGEVREIDLGKVQSPAEYGNLWAFVAVWDTTSDRLAVIAVTGLPTFHRSYFLTVDINSGVVEQVPTTLTWISDAAWARNGKQVILHGYQSSTREREFHLVDIQTHEQRQIQLFPPSTHGSLPGWNLSWSPDGSSLITQYLDNLYAINVTTQPAEK